MAYFQRENRELVRLDSCELIRSQFGLVSDYQAGVALDYLAEVSDQLLPSAEPNEKFFRLLLAVLDALASGATWQGIVYFSLWATRLSGWLPELHVCLSCGSLLDDPENPERAFFSRGHAGLICAHCRRTMNVGNSWELSLQSRNTAAQMLRKPIREFAAPAWTSTTAADLRRFLVQQIESHLERKLLTAPMLES